jgi:hypothetical protein
MDRIQNHSFNSSSLPFTEPLPSKTWGYKDPQAIIQYSMDRKQNDTYNSSSAVACIRWPGNVFTETLPNTYSGTRIQTHRIMGGIYKVHVKF